MKSYFKKKKLFVHWLVIYLINQVVNDVDINDHLMTPFQVEEFKETMFSMQPNKFLGPDGFNHGFYQYFWKVCIYDIYNECC